MVSGRFRTPSRSTNISSKVHIPIHAHAAADRMDGIGKYYHADGSVYEGQWVQGKVTFPISLRSLDLLLSTSRVGPDIFCSCPTQMEGKGVYRYANGNVYTGE